MNEEAILITPLSLENDKIPRGEIRQKEIMLSYVEVI